MSFHATALGFHGSISPSFLRWGESLLALDAMFGRFKGAPPTALGVPVLARAVLPPPYFLRRAALPVIPRPWHLQNQPCSLNSSSVLSSSSPESSGSSSSIGGRRRASGRPSTFFQSGSSMTGWSRNGGCFGPSARRRECHFDAVASASGPTTATLGWTVRCDLSSFGHLISKVRGTPRLWPSVTDDYRRTRPLGNHPAGKAPAASPFVRTVREDPRPHPST